ncbi:MAG: hypothetical protein D6679_05430 [Candidatus Hydrogenedentota bacterium]|nr:MAG: hypothetical protein D6679_05430 [Candidatus Hydrogenedentota bacterium]
MTFDDVLGDLDRRTGRGWRLSLEGVRKTLGRLGEPTYPVVLVAGTNGKGTVAFLLSEMLRRFGFRVGLATSPHLRDVRERVLIDGKMPDRGTFARAYRRFAEADEDRATYFEAVALTTHLLFQDGGIDAAVIEIGLGGRLDAFNAWDPAVSVVTNVSREHTKYLGKTLEEIAREKVAVSRLGRPLILGSDAKALREAAAETGARVFIACNDVSRGFEAKRTGEERPRPGWENFATARRAAEEFCKALEIPIDEAVIRQVRDDYCAGRLIWPGRFQILEGRPTILIDAAHNPGAAHYLAARLRLSFPEKPVTALAGFLEDKDAAGFVQAFDSLVTRWIITRPPSPRGTLPRALPVSNIFWEEDPFRALELARAEAVRTDSLLLVTGSLYLLGLLWEELTGGAPFSGDP